MSEKKNNPRTCFSGRPYRNPPYFMDFHGNIPWFPCFITLKQFVETLPADPNLQVEALGSCWKDALADLIGPALGKWDSSHWFLYNSHISYIYIYVNINICQYMSIPIHVNICQYTSYSHGQSSWYIHSNGQDFGGHIHGRNHVQIHHHPIEMTGARSEGTVTCKLATDNGWLNTVCSRLLISPDDGLLMNKWITAQMC